jgi:hypothetical protein
MGPDTAGTWRGRFISGRIDTLTDLPRSDKPPVYGIALTRTAIFDLLEKPPPKGQAVWDGKVIASELKISVDIVWMIFRKKVYTFKDNGHGALARIPSSRKKRQTLSIFIWIHPKTR